MTSRALGLGKAAGRLALPRAPMIPPPRPAPTPVAHRALPGLVKPRTPHPAYPTTPEKEHANALQKRDAFLPGGISREAVLPGDVFARHSPSVASGVGEWSAPRGTSQEAAGQTSHQVMKDLALLPSWYGGGTPNLLTLMHAKHDTYAVAGRAAPQGDVAPEYAPGGEQEMYDNAASDFDAMPRRAAPEHQVGGGEQRFHNNPTEHFESLGTLPREPAPEPVPGYEEVGDHPPAYAREFSPQMLDLLAKDPENAMSPAQVASRKALGQRLGTRDPADDGLLSANAAGYERFEEELAHRRMIEANKAAFAATEVGLAAKAISQ